MNKLGVHEYSVPNMVCFFAAEWGFPNIQGKLLHCNWEFSTRIRMMYITPSTITHFSQNFVRQQSINKSRKCTCSRKC